jgi:hypothetical protein
LGLIERMLDNMSYPPGHPLHACIGCPHDGLKEVTDPVGAAMGLGGLHRFGASIPRADLPYVRIPGDHDGSEGRVGDGLNFLVPWPYKAVSVLGKLMELTGELLIDGSNSVESWAYHRWVRRVR